MNSDTPQLKSFRSFEARQDGDRQTSRSESYLRTGRESSVISATIQADSTGRDMSIDLDVSADATHLKRFVVSVDFGTTFSSISFLILPRNTPPDSLDPHILYHHIQTIDHFPEEPCLGLAESRKEVPTEIWYPKEEYLEDSIMGDGTGSDDSPEGDMPFHLQNEDEENTYWGYEVYSCQRIDTDPNQNRRMGGFKLLFDESELTAQIRLDLEPTLDMMKKKKIIKDREDVISHYLKHLFSHAKEELSEKHEYTNDCPLGFVLCVPPIWTPKACRIMQTNMVRAIQESGYGSFGNCIDNLFIVSEPEAAAAYVIESTTTVLPKEAFMLLDAGGGTVDAITYTVNQTCPLRLEAEGVEAGGALCGSSYLNKAFQEHLSARLKDEDYLERNGISIRSIVDTEVVKFENNIKRKIDIIRPTSVFEFVEIQDLRADPRKNFGRNRLRLTHNDLRGIFLPVLEKVSGLMERQLELAKMRRINVTKVILIGGFANSPSLRSFLKRKLASIKSYQDEDIPLWARRRFLVPSSEPSTRETGRDASAVQVMDFDVMNRSILMTSLLTGESFPIASLWMAGST
ncbi:hypothetical protein HYALB_00009003 [Hymenoscyphus albidus]|uniref:Uncharacterized protein n=1 Tax=Hymenoscyphus albidus TaxID=595503 RepID=A0A9N9M4I5_9HELO|nr:hypothetical protein HYALB_00009003 [Hymenoscyphus albidus]